MDVITYASCFHCKKLGHWKDDCPLLKKPEDKDQHEQRLTEITQRFLDLQIGPVAKRRMIETENRLWLQRQKEMAKQ